MGMIVLSRLCFPVLVNVSTQQVHIYFKHAESEQPLVMEAIIIVVLLSFHLHHTISKQSYDALDSSIWVFSLGSCNTISDTFVG